MRALLATAMLVTAAQAEKAAYVVVVNPRSAGVPSEGGGNFTLDQGSGVNPAEPTPARTPSVVRMQLVGANTEAQAGAPPMVALEGSSVARPWGARTPYQAVDLNVTGICT